MYDIYIFTMVDSTGGQIWGDKGGPQNSRVAKQVLQDVSNALGLPKKHEDLEVSMAMGDPEKTWFIRTDLNQCMICMI